MLEGLGCWLQEEVEGDKLGRLMEESEQVGKSVRSIEHTWEGVLLELQETWRTVRLNKGLASPSLSAPSCH